MDRSCVLPALQLLASVAACCAGITQAQTFPHKPLRIITSEVGGGADFQVRLIGHGISAALGQQVIVENRGGGVIPGDTVAKALPDGYTLLYTGSAHWLLPLMRNNVPYDPVKDFVPVTLPVRAPNLLVVHPAVPAQSVKELIALAKAKPGTLNYGSGAPGSSSHLAPELFKAMADVDIVHIPYKGTGPAINDLLGGQLQIMFPNAASVMPHVKVGRLRALGVSSAQPSPLAPGVPTVSTGLPGYESVSNLGIFAPARTPVAVIRRINQEVVRYLATAEAKERMLNAGVETVGSTPEQLAAVVNAEVARMGKMIRAVGIRAD